MGRPRDEEMWAQVDVLPSTSAKEKWKCKYCNKDFAGGASRIRQHLYHEGKNIGHCSKVRISSSSSHTTTTGASVVTPSVFTKKQEATNDQLVKFFMSNDLSLDRIKDKDPSLVSLLTRVAQYGVPSCLHRDGKVFLEKSLSNWVFEVNQYMLSVKESLSTTGCTFIRYNLNLEKDTPICGLYSPKGFIFVEGPHSDSHDHIRDALKNNVLNLSFDDVTRCINHNHSCSCELIYHSADYLSLPCGSVDCVRNVLQRAWDAICGNSKWVEKVIQASEKVYKLLSHSDASTAKVQEVFKKHGDGMAMSSFARLKSIMHLKDRNIILSGDVDRSVELWSEVEHTIKDEDFWDNGKELIQALNPMLEVVHLVDTLCPVAPYIHLALGRATRTLMSCYHRDPDKYEQIWHPWNNIDKIRHTESEAAIYSPIHDMGGVDRSRMISWISDRYPELEEELHRYESDNPFKKVPDFLLMQDHPVKLWEKYGGEFPMLKARAIKMLSLAESCMCNQIKKKMDQIHGCGDNVVMRLNYKMMEEFKKLGDSIYKPPPEWAAQERYIRSGEKSDIGSGEAASSRIVETITNAESELPNGLQPEFANPYGLISSTETATHTLPPYPTSITGASMSLHPQDTNWYTNTGASEHMTNQSGFGYMG